MKGSYFLLLFISLGLAGCGKQLEFPKGNLLSVKPPKDVNKYQLGYEEVMEFREGELAEYVIAAVVPDDSPVVTVEGLPPSATFSEKTFRLTWTPAPGMSKGTRDARFATYPIKIHLRGTLDPLIVVTRKAVLVVFESSKSERVP